MALTSRDETDLLLPLFSVAHEVRPFSAFLERLRRRTGAISASVTIASRMAHDAVTLFVGPDLRKMALDLQLHDLNLVNRLQYRRLRPGRVYSGDEMEEHDPVRKAHHWRDMRKLRLSDERVVRLIAEDAFSAWLTIASERECSAADGALLSNLAPYVAAAVRNFVRAEQQIYADTLNARTLDKAGAGWILFEGTGRVIAIAPKTASLLAATFGHPIILGQRLRELGPSVERAINNASAQFAQAETTSDLALVLTEHPRIEAILSRPPQAMHTHLETPTMLATCRLTRTASTTRAHHLSQVYALPLREAELAILLSDGLSLAQASEVMGLTLETTRNYSKRLFAKLNVRGQAELVRAVYESCAGLS